MSKKNSPNDKTVHLKEELLQGDTTAPEGSELGGIEPVGSGPLKERRAFLKRAAVTTAAGAATVLLSREAARLIPGERSLQERYDGDVTPMDKVWQKRDFVLMTDSEKAELVATFEDRHRDKTKR